MRVACADSPRQSRSVIFMIWYVTLTASSLSELLCYVASTCTPTPYLGGELAMLKPTLLLVVSALSYMPVEVVTAADAAV